MSTVSMREISTVGLYVGIGVALVPATATLLIASSRVILVNIIANAIIMTLTAGLLRINIYGISLIEVPFLWKISMISAIVGGSIIALSLTAALANMLYQRMFAHRNQ